MLIFSSRLSTFSSISIRLLSLRLHNTHTKSITVASCTSNRSQLMPKMSTNKLIECVPNFSDGRSQSTINAIADAIRATFGVTLLDVDAGASTNRTVYSFVGSPEAVVEGALAAAKVAFERIDMTAHKGEHKRLGAMDVCPFIPISGGATMADCVEAANKLGSRLAQELDIPVYLYGHAARADYRRQVPQIRAGEYEELSARLKEAAWRPDYGPAKFVPGWGASIVGARNFLIAYNVNLVATKEQANRIAFVIRATRPNGEPGRLPATQAMGWYLKEANIAQVTVNILDIEATKLHQVYEEVVSEAKALKLPVTGSEVVGLVPLKAMLDVAEYYIEKESLFILEEDQKIHLAINRLGLNSLGHFDPNKRIIEYMIVKPETDKLVGLSVRKFVGAVGDRTTAPGGGSVAATVGALGVGLIAMVSKLSYGKKIFDATDARMRQVIPPLHQAIEQFLKFVDEDTEAFNEYSEAMKLPSSNEDEVKRRQAALQLGLYKAVQVPLALARTVDQLWPTVEALVPLYYSPTTSDLQVGVHCLKTAIYGASYNVEINLKSDPAESFRDEITKEIQNYVQQANVQSAKILAAIASRE